jgi:hypothetical protein
MQRAPIKAFLNRARDKIDGHPSLTSAAIEDEADRPVCAREAGALDQRHPRSEAIVEATVLKDPRLESVYRNFTRYLFYCSASASVSNLTRRDR